MMVRVGVFLVLVICAGGRAEAQIERFSPDLHQVLTALEAQSRGEALALPHSSLAGIKYLNPKEALASGAGEPVITTLIVYSNLDAVRRAGFEISTTTKRVSIVHVPLSRIHELETMPGIVYVDVPTAKYRLALDASMEETGGTEAHGGTKTPPYTGVTGNGVVVGIIDTGIDYAHEDFMDAGGNTRILSLWDQTGFGNEPAEYTYGRECTAAEIDAGTCTETDDVGHGTHVAGIAAGDGSEGGTRSPYTYVGVAPEADIVAVKFTTTKGDDAIIQGAEYIFDTAEALAKPAVVNISLGSGLGPHDGTTLLEMALSDLTGPGRAIVAAAGNDGDVDAHASVFVRPNNKTTLFFTMGAYVPNPGPSNDVIRVRAWYPGSTDLRFTLRAPNTSHSVGPVSHGNVDFSNTNSGYLYLSNSENNPQNGDRECVMQAYDLNQGTTPPQGEWSIVITNNSSTRIDLDLWVYSDMVDPDGFPADIGWDASVVDPLMTINAPATADEVIAAGAYVTKTTWKSTDGFTYGYQGETVNLAASFSSSGPRRDGVPKPEIAAPGMGIVSALSQDAPTPNSFIVRDNAHTISQGTSQASPHVAGTVALLFQKNDSLRPSDLRNVLAASAYQDTYAILSPFVFGEGKLRIADASDEVTPVRLLFFSAARLGTVVRLTWEAAESDVLAYRIERSGFPQGPFESLGRVDPTPGVQSFEDPEPLYQDSWYRLAGVERSGGPAILGTVRVAGRRPQVTLSQNAPNPVRDETQFAFSLEKASKITLSLVDLQGRAVLDLAQGTFPAGDNTVEWDGTLPNGARIAAGIYFYRLTTPQKIVTKRLVVIP